MKASVYRRSDKLHRLVVRPRCTLEPSAGTGNLPDALLRAGQSRCELAAIERESSLVASMRQRFQVAGEDFPVVNRCFLDWSDDVRGQVHFPYILMNPPFRTVSKHVVAARSLFGREGYDTATLVDLVPISLNDPDATTIKVLPADTFAGITAHTKIIRIRK